MKKLLLAIVLSLVLFMACSRVPDDFFYGHWQTEESKQDIFIDDTNFYTYEDGVLTARPYKIVKKGKNDEGMFALLVDSDGFMGEMVKIKDGRLRVYEINEKGDRNLQTHLTYIDAKTPE